MNIYDYLAQFAPIPQQHFDNTYFLAQNAPNTPTYLQTSTYDLANQMPFLASIPGMGFFGTAVGGIHDLLQGQYKTMIPDAIKRYQGFMDWKKSNLYGQPSSTKINYDALMSKKAQSDNGNSGGISNFPSTKDNRPTYTQQPGSGYTAGANYSRPKAVDRVSKRGGMGGV